MPRNAGQKYEEYIQNVLKEKGVYPLIIKHNNDAGFIHKNVPYYVEVKNSKAHDFGQKKLIWSKSGGWQWSQKDEITDLYDSYNIISRIKNFEPKKFTMPNDASFKDEYKKTDQRDFESGVIELQDFSGINKYYAKKECYYIQIEERGFYYLERDEAVLSSLIPPFKPKVTMRLRAKTHHSFPHYDYSFFAVLVAYPKSLKESNFDIEPKSNKKFPPIVKI